MGWWVGRFVENAVNSAHALASAGEELNNRIREMNKPMKRFLQNVSLIRFHRIGTTNLTSNCLICQIYFQVSWDFNIIEISLMFPVKSELRFLEGDLDGIRC